jgi:enoyl-CoA hydratase
MQFVDIRERDGVAVVTIDRPPANALDPELLADGLAALDALLADPPSAVVLTGAGRFFSGGADLRVVPELAPEAQEEMARGVNRLFAGWHRFPRPLVTAVNGHAVAGGLILALCGDYRLGPTSGQFGLTEARVGIPFPSMAMAVVQAELAPGVARRLVLGAELVDAATANALGVFDETVADDAVLDRALEVARNRAELPPATYEAVKHRLRLTTATDEERAAISRGWVSTEAADAAAAVLARSRRTPR